MCSGSDLPLLARRILRHAERLGLRVRLILRYNPPLLVHDWVSVCRQSMGIGLGPVGLGFLVGSPTIAAVQGPANVWWKGVTLASVRPLLLASAFPQFADNNFLKFRVKRSGRFDRSGRIPRGVGVFACENPEEAREDE